jgi:iron complex transport system substrate-binding protein
MKRKRSILFFLTFLTVVIFNSCKGHIETSEKGVSRIENNEVKYAERFHLEKRRNYTLLKIINPWQGADNVNQIYYLVRRGMRVPQELDSSKVIFVPIRKIICMSTTHLAMISALKEDGTITGVSGAGFLYAKTLSDRIENGQIQDIGYDDNINKEMVIQISPDLIMIYGVGSESSGYLGKLKELGIKVLFNADYLETNPLGKAEWIKLFGALYCKEEMADKIFSNVAETYNNLKTYINEKIVKRPNVLLGLPWKDTWYISPGNSYISMLISDAGGNYLWNETNSATSMPYGIENVYIRALNADFWLNIGNVSSRNEIGAIDQRLEDLPCFKNGNLYNNNKRISSESGNDYWESGGLNPQIILKDISSILHPGFFPEYELFYYKKIH